MTAHLHNLQILMNIGILTYDHYSPFIWFILTLWEEN